MTHTIGKYTVLQELGKGSCGTVYLATDITGDKFAIKRMSRQTIAQCHMADQVKREIKVMKMLHHNNIVDLREVLLSPNSIYLVMEYVGKELFSVIEHGPLDECLAKRYFVQLMTAISFMHAQSIAHRDLKPENLLLSASNDLKVCDFGMARLIELAVESVDPMEEEGDLSDYDDEDKYDNNNEYNEYMSEEDAEQVDDEEYVKQAITFRKVYRKLTTMCGTIGYAAPEVLRHEAYDGRKADVWSCGVVLYVLLTSTMPFDEDFNFLGYPDSFSEHVSSLLEKIFTSPDERLSAEEVLEHSFCVETEVSS
jgi:5'-AMP-activated protein kinase catalytic alpha subunit